MQRPEQLAYFERLVLLEPTILRLLAVAKSQLLQAAQSGHTLTHFKMANGRRNRSWAVDDAALIDRFGDAVLVQQERKYLSVAEAEKVFGKDAIKPLFRWSEPPIILKPASDIAESVTVNCSEFMND